MKKSAIILHYWDAYRARFWRTFYYPLVLKAKGIKYKSVPIIRGRLKIYNHGECMLGANLTFNSTYRANPAGMYKPCSVFVESPGKLFIDDHSGFSGVSIYCINEITIGKHLFCGANVSIWDTDFHPLDYMDRRTDDQSKVKTAPIRIGDDVFIGANSMILKGVTIGDRSVIGAGSVVTKNIPPDEVWAGNPAVFIRSTNKKVRE